MTVSILGVASVEVFGFLALFWTIPSMLFKDAAAAGSVAVVSSMGALGGLFNPIFTGWISDVTGSIYYALGALLLLSLCLIYGCFLRR